ncbi:MAG: hypothetical protein ABI769_04365 [Pseudomonadota bacterium]
MSSEGIMRRARHLYLASMLVLIVPAVFAQTPPARKDDDLDVTMRVIVDPNAKVPDEIVRRIQLPKPAQPVTPSVKPAQPGAQGQQRAAEAREQGREFGQQVAEEAKQRAEEARRNKPSPPATPGPPHTPPGRPTPPPGG